MKVTFYGNKEREKIIKEELKMMRANALEMAVGVIDFVKKRGKFD